MTNTKLRSFLVLTAGVLVLTGCSSTPTTVDRGTIHARTFNYVRLGAKPTPEYAENRQHIHQLVQGAITKSLSAHGLDQLSTGGDVTVAYLIITGNNVSTKSINDYFGYGEDAMALHDLAHDAYDSSRNPNYFESGTLVIDIIDSKNFELLKRGYATRPLLGNVSDDVRAAAIQDVVDEILGDLRVEP